MAGSCVVIGRLPPLLPPDANTVHVRWRREQWKPSGATSREQYGWERLAKSLATSGGVNSIVEAFAKAISIQNTSLRRFTSSARVAFIALPSPGLAQDDTGWPRAASYDPFVYVAHLHCDDGPIVSSIHQIASTFAH